LGRNEWKRGTRTWRLIQGGGILSGKTIFSVQSQWRGEKVPRQASVNSLWERKAYLVRNRQGTSRHEGAETGEGGHRQLQDKIGSSPGLPSTLRTVELGGREGCCIHLRSTQGRGSPQNMWGKERASSQFRKPFSRAQT